ncbi:hypothetical protein KQI85_07430 [Falcatimonas sp. MSJ-15]|uniref:hypothetical protein n=1 Tax=Falcatimonas sp. MSJ-15 TaxID=2841515 RepID=UPI001C111DD1|nr:hypothetical protein [Falcatimonas sp. MSJ-15]MBU5470199.1 hypothetical protein [Falcatimonas sp. MSJ-15]
MRRRYIYALALLTMLSGCNRAGDDYDEIVNQGGFLIEFASNSDNEDNEDNDYEEDSTSEDSENDDMSDELNDEDNEEKESDSEDSDEDELEDSDEDNEDTEDTGNIDYASGDYEEDELMTEVGDTVYDIYHNENFGYALIYPDTFTQSDESGSGDGVTMSDDNGSTLRMWGAYNAAGSTGSEALDQYIASSSNVAYSSAQDNYWCYTCRTDEGKIEYRAGYIDSDYEAGFELIYDEGLQENYGEAVNAMMEHLLNGNVF